MVERRVRVSEITWVSSQGLFANQNSMVLESEEINIEMSSELSTTGVNRLRNYSKTAYAVLKNRQWKATMRGPATFFGIKAGDQNSTETSSEVAPFTVPKTNEIGSRLTKNFSFFATNYALFSTVLMTYEIISDWTIMLWLFGIFGIWTFVLRAAAAGNLFPLEVAGVTVEKRVLYLGMSLLTSIILTIYVGYTFLFVTGCTCAFSALHSTFRNPLSYKTHDSLEETDPFTHSMEEGGVEMSGDGI